MGIKNIVKAGFINTAKLDAGSIYYVLYYTLLESLLVLSIPLTSSFVINSLMSHSSISAFVLGSVISIVFIFVVMLRLLQEYIIEKFEQRVFVEQGFDIANKALQINKESATLKDPVDKLMNYFFDITTVQKIFPVFVLNGAGLIVQIFMSLILLMIFDLSLFYSAFFIFVVYVVLTFVLGYNGVIYAVERSDAKHAAIYFLQKIPVRTTSAHETLETLDHKMSAYVDARQKHFRVMFKQLALSFIVQGIIITGFFLQGSLLVISGEMPVGEFVAAEIIVVALIYSINSFVKQIDYIYEGIEGFYKIGKLSSSLEEMHHDV